MILRPLRRTDTEPLLQMWNASARYDPMAPELLEEKTWGDTDFDPAMALVSEQDGDLTGFMVGLARSTADGPLGVIKLAAVAAGHRRRGTGSRLLQSVETLLSNKGARTVRVCESPPNYLTPGIDGRYSAAPHFFEKHGYRRWGEACNMTVDLEGRSFSTADEEQALRGLGIEVRRARPEDAEAVAQLLDRHWPSWNAEVGLSLGNCPPTLHLALHNGEAVAFSAWDANNRGTGWFGPMGTAPGARRQGIGHVLLFRCLSDIAASGQAVATIPWVDPVGFYEQCVSAAVSRIFHRYEKVLNP
jgi:GNAT superfamily N-acetyltransferase